MKRLKTTESKTLYEALKASTNPKDILLQIMFETGCRVSEAAALGPRSLRNSKLAIKGLKGSGDRHVSISTNLESKLEDLTSYDLYCQSFSRSLNLQSYRRTLTRRFHGLTEALFGERYNLHMLRHSAFTSLYLATKDIKLTQAWAGHKSGASTMRYITLLDEEKANDIVQRLLEA